MSDYYRRGERYDDRHDRRYPPRDDYDRDSRGRNGRYSPPLGPRSRSRERDDYPRDRDRRDSRDRDEFRDPYSDSRERDYRSPPRYDRERYSPLPPRSPSKRDVQEIHEDAPSEPRSQRYNAETALGSGKPNTQVIFRGIDKSMTEADLLQILMHQGAAIESVIVIRDKETRESRGFAFVKFLALEAAQHYMELHAPVVEIAGNQVKIAYSLGRGEEDNGWTCEKCGLINFPRREVCYRCTNPKHEIPSSPPRALTKKAAVYNDGEGDVGDTQSQFILIRNLDTMLQEETIFKGLCKLDTRPKRILLIRDRKTKVSWGFAFAEYQDSSYAKAALDRFQELKSFKIEKTKVKLSFCHPGVFVPSYEESVKYSFKTGSGAQVAYWDEAGYASQWAEPKEEGIHLKYEIDEAPRDEEMEKFLNDIKRSEALHATAATIIQEPVMLTKPVEDSSKRESTTPIDPAKKKRKVETVASIARKPAAQLEKWATKREELKASEAEVSEFADLSQMCCILCKRKFQSIEEIQKHERLSKLHQSNLENDEIRNSALAKIQKRRAGSQAESTEYRDRARERRIQFNQPDRPDLPHPNPRIAAKQAQVAAAKKVPSPEPEPPKPNKGAKLLAAMGWTQGSGLGAEGSGIVEPIKAGQYAEGVGLGAGSMKIVGEDLANKEDDGSYRAYVQRVKDVARERYQSANIFEEEDEEK